MFCETCGHQYSDVCGTCEGLDGVPVKYTNKTPSLFSDVIWKLKDIRVLVNAGYNNRGCYLSGETCKSIVRLIDQVILYVMEKEEEE